MHGQRIRGSHRVWRRKVGEVTYGSGCNWVGGGGGAHTLTQAPVLNTATPPPGGGREADSGLQYGGSNPVTLEVEVDEGMLPGWGMLKDLLLGDAHNLSNNLSRLAMMWNVCHLWPGGARFFFN